MLSDNKLSKQVRLGVGNQRVVVRTFRLPAIEDPKEMEAAVRFQAQEQIPMPLDQAVLEHQVVGGVPAEEGSEPQVDVVVVAARRDMVCSFLEPLRRAGLEPVGVDLSAFGMIRALAGRRRSRAGRRRRPRRAQRSHPLLQRRRRDEPRRRARPRLPFHPRLRGRDGGDLGRLATERGLSPEHATQWLTHVGLEQPLSRSRATRRPSPRCAAPSKRGRGLIDELRLSLDYYGAQEGAVPVARVVLCGPGSAIPGLVRRWKPAGLPIAASPPGRAV